MAAASPYRAGVGAAGPPLPRIPGDRVPDPFNLDFTTRTALGREELPIVAARPRDRTIPNSAALVMDEDAIDGLSTADALATLGLHPVVESTLQAAARHISLIGAPCLVVLELAIPKALDFIVSLRRREELRDAAVVAYTWRGDAETLAAALRADVDGYVMKTGEREPLLRAVRCILHLSAAEGVL